MNIVRFLQDRSPIVTRRRMEAYVQKIEDDTRDTHDALWKILNVLCDEFDIKLSITAREAGVSE